MLPEASRAFQPDSHRAKLVPALPGRARSRDLKTTPRARSSLPARAIPESGIPLLSVVGSRSIVLVGSHGQTTKNRYWDPGHGREWDPTPRGQKKGTGIPLRQSEWDPTPAKRVGSHSRPTGIPLPERRLEKAKSGKPFPSGSECRRPCSEVSKSS